MSETHYFVCVIDSKGSPGNCVQLPGQQTMSYEDMFLIIGALWSAIAGAFVVRLICKQLV